MSSNEAIRFTQEDLDVFSRASGDRNPLHLSSSYASRTAYGQQVVFGVLGCVACLGSVDEKAAGAVSRVVADFQRPMFLGVDYRLARAESRDGVVVRLLDGTIPVLTVNVQYQQEERVSSPPGITAVFPRASARVLAWNEITAGAGVEGEYRADSSALEGLYRRWSLSVDPLVAEALLWSSYLVGMELPGESALFFRASLNFTGKADGTLPLHFRADVSNVNQSLSQLRMATTLRSGEQTVVSGQLTAFFRPEMPSLCLAQFPSAEDRGSGLLGKAAVVLGASRGLGAAMAMVMAAEGARVLAVSRSEAAWQADLSAEERVNLTFVTGDAGDEVALRGVAEKIQADFGRLDFLVCSAFPPIPSLRLEENAAERIKSYLGQATGMVLNPLCALLPQLSRSRGATVFISSIAVEQPVRDWPHYVAAKNAAESLCNVARLQFPETSTLIVRPERIATEMTNTPMGRQGAASPLTVARLISQRLQQPFVAGSFEVMRTGEAKLPEARKEVCEVS